MPLILADRIHFLSGQGWSRPIVLRCVDVGGRRQMFPFKILRKDMWQRDTSCLQNRFFSLFPATSSPLASLSLSILDINGVHSLQPTVSEGFFIFTYHDRLSNGGYFTAGWLMDRAALRSCSNDAENYETAFVCEHRKRQRAYMGISTGWIILPYFDEKWCGLRLISTALAGFTSATATF